MPIWSFWYPMTFYSFRVIQFYSYTFSFKHKVEHWKKIWLITRYLWKDGRSLPWQRILFLYESSFSYKGQCLLRGTFVSLKGHFITIDDWDSTTKLIFKQVTGTPNIFQKFDDANFPFRFPNGRTFVRFS